MNQKNKKAELEQKIQKINEREKQLKAQLRAIDAKEREAFRKKETRAKIILGGFVASKIKSRDQTHLTLLESAIKQATPRDAEALKNYRQILLK